MDNQGIIAPPKGDILIVDDMPVNLRLLSHMLGEQGYKVRSVINGQMALTATRAAPPDLILLDINMPGMNGYEVCERLKEDESTQDIPVIFISALDEIQDKVKAFTVGGLDYITKPFQFEEVLARVETHLSLRRLQKQLQEANRRFEQELALAGKIQTSFLPEVPQTPGWQVSVVLKAARETSGDFYDIHALPDGRWAIVVADVVDKGVGAALYMALSWILLRTYMAEYPTQPDRVCSAVNHRMVLDAPTNQFVTVFYGVLDPASGYLTYCNAGHNPPYLFSAGNPEEVQALWGTGLPLGVFEEEEWQHESVQLAPGDVLVLYTDGVTEAQNVKRAMFGDERLLDCVRSHPGRRADELRDAILHSVGEFVGTAPQVDDITLAVVMRNPDGAG
jgi:sigma-B regulation protein RsbU (phosphoserine phosphatase)